MEPESPQFEYLHPDVSEGLSQEVWEIWMGKNINIL